MSDPLLAIQRVSKHFGGITALHQVDFSIKSNQIKGLIGPNGAGKTTLFNLITGVFPVSAGKVLLKNRPISNLPTYQIARAGIVRTFQNVKLFPNLTVLENVMVGGFASTRMALLSALFNRGTGKAEAELRSEASKLLEFVGLADRASNIAAALPFGQQRLLEIARALITKPELLLLDEPAAGLSTPERLSLAELIKEIRKLGITVLLVEHDMDLVMTVCDEIVVLEFGSKLAEGKPEEIQNNRRVIAAYLGEEVVNA